MFWTAVAEQLQGDPRVYFAAERTFLAWIRTGLAMMGFGFVVARFGLFLREIAVIGQSELPQGSGSLIAGTALVLLGVLVNIFAAINHLRFRANFQRGTVSPMPGSHFAIIIAGLLAFLGAAMAVYLILNR